MSFPSFSQIESKIKLVVIGTSTGGPQALASLFRSLPNSLPVTFAIAQHIPAGYTAPLAARLSLLGPVKIVEATDGLELLPGHAVIAPGGMHLRIREDRKRLYAVVSREPIETIHHPSVNVLFESAADQLGSATLGVVLTGMGDDGMLGASAIVAAGGRVIAESEGSCVVYGMPRVVIEARLVLAEALIEDMSALIVNSIRSAAAP